MSSMEEVWQRQMRSLQCSLSIAKKSLDNDVCERKSDASVDQSWDSSRSREESNGGIRSSSHTVNGADMNASTSVISHLSDEFEQRAHVFLDDANFLVEVKSGQADANLNPDRELKRLKNTFDAWKKDFGIRLRETKAILHKLGANESSGDRAKKNWWGRLNKNSSRIV